MGKSPACPGSVCVAPGGHTVEPLNMSPDRGAQRVLQVEMLPETHAGSSALTGTHPRVRGAPVPGYQSAPRTQLPWAPSVCDALQSCSVTAVGWAAQVTVQPGLGVAAGPEASARSSGAVAPCVASPSAGWCVLASQWARVVGAFTWWPLHSSLEKRWNLPDFLKARPKADTALPLPDPCVGVGHKARLFSGGGECGSAPHNEKKSMAATFGGYQLQCTCEFYFIIYLFF